MPDINRTESQFGVPLKLHDNLDGSYTQYEYALPGAIAAGTSGGPAQNQIQGVWANRITSNPTGVDITLPATSLSTTVPSTSTTLTQAVTGRTTAQVVTVASSANLQPGQWIAVDTGGSLENIQIGAVNVLNEQKAVIPNTIAAIFQNNHSIGATVVGGYTFFLTDVVITGSPASGNPLVMVKAILTSVGSISTGSQTVSLNQLSTSSKYGGQIYVGQVLDIDVVGGGSYEAVVVTAVTTNTQGIVTAFTATFTKTHSASCLIGVPIQGAQINSTKGIEEIGIETQPTAPPGATIALNIAAYTGSAFYNIRGFFQ